MHKVRIPDEIWTYLGTLEKMYKKELENGRKAARSYDKGLLDPKMVAYYGKENIQKVLGDSVKMYVRSQEKLRDVRMFRQFLEAVYDKYGDKENG